MKKKLFRSFSLLACAAVLVAGLVGCGGPSQEKLLQTVADANAGLAAGPIAYTYEYTGGEDGIRYEILYSPDTQRLYQCQYGEQGEAVQEILATPAGRWMRVNGGDWAQTGDGDPALTLPGLGDLTQEAQSIDPADCASVTQSGDQITITYSQQYCDRLHEQGVENARLGMETTLANIPEENKDEMQAFLQGQVDLAESQTYSNVSMVYTIKDGKLAAYLLSMEQSYVVPEALGGSGQQQTGSITAQLTVLPSEDVEARLDGFAVG